MELKTMQTKKTLAVISLVLLLVACPNPTQSQQAAAPTFSPLYGNFSTDQSVTIASATTGATIYYTTDGTDPTTASATYGGPIPVAGDGTSVTLKALAAASGMSDSAVTHAYYTIHYAGTLDTGFATGNEANAAVYPIVLQSDGKILAAGAFSTYNSASAVRVVRLNTDGSIDPSFSGTGLGADALVMAMTMHQNGKIIIGGSFTHFDGTSRGHIARLNADGGLDTSFAAGSGADSDIFGIAVQNDGKTIIGGLFTMYDGTVRNAIARLNVDGSLDHGFATGAGPDNWVQAILLRPDGKIIIGGNFTTYDSVPRECLARLNADGSLDASFTSGVGGLGDELYAAAMQKDGKIIIGGHFSTYSASARGNIARVNADGSLDSTFATGPGATGGDIESIAVNDDGTILIAGSFTAYDGTSRFRLARLSSDGSLDTSFPASGTGASGSLYAVTPQADGRILIGGNFITYNLVPCGYIARIWN